MLLAILIKEKDKHKKIKHFIVTSKHPWMVFVEAIEKCVQYQKFI
jgi:hypothetical protein